jgi:His-Xaa-Ser system radical SAM maturase HxsC
MGDKRGLKGRGARAVSVRLHSHGKALIPCEKTTLGRVTFSPLEPALRGDSVLVLDHEQEIDLAGYAGVLVREALPPERVQALLFAGPPIVYGLSVDHLEGGDIVSLGPNGYVRTLYRIASPHNAIFTTDRCNSFCLMCSQPPKAVNDADRISEHLRLIELISPQTVELGITGGEPTLLKSDLLRIIRRCKELLPATALHILSNGRLFYYGSFARDLAEIGHPDLMIGIPLYSDIDSEHDFVVQAAGAFDQTLMGLHNLGRYGVQVEIRVVIHRHTYQRLPRLAEFVYRNLPFAAHVALMGLEIMGFALPNLSDLWIDPQEYRDQLKEATLFLASRGMNVSIYNHQLCVLPRELWPYSRKSISDWKNEYLAVCTECAVQEACGGFFSSGVLRRYSRHIEPIRAPAG